MKVRETRVYRGPNLYSINHTVIRLILDLEEMEQRPSDSLGDFVDKLVEAVPSLWTHRCSEGVEGGFITRLRRGTWMGHILEHVSLELQTLAGTPVTFGKTRGTGEEGVYSVIIEYQEEKVGRAAINLASRLLHSLFPPDLPSGMSTEERAAFDFKKELEDLIRLADDTVLGPSTRSLVDAAHKRGIPYIRLNEYSLVQLGYGKYQKRLQASVTSLTSQVATDIAGDKRLTNRLLDEAGVPVPCHQLVETEDEAVEAAEEIGYPVVTKPLDLSHGRGASLNLVNAEQVREGFRQAELRGGTPIIVEKFMVGNDYRVLVINDQVIAVAERIPGHVVGDGAHTIQELVDITNADPRRGVGHEKVLTRIVIDHQANRLLDQAGYTLQTVLPKGQVFFLRSTGNMSTGGTAIDRTDEINFETAELARRAARIIGLDVAGIDIITPDISQPLREVGGGIVEVNAAPGFRMHVAPTEGKARDAAGPVIDMLFPPGTPSRIPIAAITGTNGKTTTSFMVAHILKISGHNVGQTSTDGIYIDGQRYLKGDMTGPWSAHVVLRDSKIDAAVLETARGGILREGLGFDRCDVGAVLNVTADHLGLFGINTVEQMAEVKGLLVEVVKPDGYAVLNADDPLTARMRERTPGTPFYFTMSDKNQLVKDHINDGLPAVVLENSINGSMITLYDNHRHIPIMLAHLIPATLDGAAKFNIANAMAAAAIAYGMGVSVRDIRQGLQTFAMSYHMVPGRMNIFDECGFRVIMDYAHNQAAMSAITSMVKTMRRPHKIGMLSAPGDRRDSDIIDLGRIAGDAFDYLILKEDESLRGRAPGEISELLRRGAEESHLDGSHIILIPDEMEATDKALRMAQDGDLVVLFADDVDGVWDRVVAYKQCEEQIVE